MKDEALDKALAKRLAKLSTLPVEMEGVEKAVQERILGGLDGALSMNQEGALGAQSANKERMLGAQSANKEGMLGAQMANKVGALGAQLANKEGVAGGLRANEERVFGAHSGSKEGYSDAVRQNPLKFPRMWRTMVGIAASIALVAIVGSALLQSQPAQASLMVQLHRDIVAGKIPTMKVESMAEVNEAFKAFGQHGIQMSAPDMHVMACCMKNVGNKQVYCVLLQDGNEPVTLTIADLGVGSPAGGDAVMYKGEAFHVERSGELTMTTVDRAGHRVCLIGAVPAERLMGLAEGLKF